MKTSPKKNFTGVLESFKKIDKGAVLQIHDSLERTVLSYVYPCLSQT